MDTFPSGHCTHSCTFKGSATKNPDEHWKEQDTEPAAEYNLGFWEHGSGGSLPPMQKKPAGQAEQLLGMASADTRKLPGVHVKSATGFR